MDGRQIMTGTKSAGRSSASPTAGRESRRDRGLVLIGIQRRGVPWPAASRFAVEENEGVALPVGALDNHVSTVMIFSLIAQQPGRQGYPAAGRSQRPHGRPRRRRPLHRSDRPGGDGLPWWTSAGRGDPPRGLVDRGHRELPIRADHVGQDVPTSRDEVVKSPWSRLTARMRSGIERVDLPVRRPEDEHRERSPTPTPTPTPHPRPRSRLRRMPAGAKKALLDVDALSFDRDPAGHAHDRRHEGGPGPSIGKSPRSGARRHDPLLRGLDADARELRGRRQEPLRGRGKHRRVHVVGVEGRVRCDRSGHWRRWAPT